MTKILVVDDKQENLDFLQAFLGKHGYAVDTAHHGAEALAIAARAMPDLVISDLLMPVMDGYTLLRHWKTDATFEHVPFIVYTATFTDADDQRFGQDLGADAYILKPAKASDLLARVKKVLATAASASPLQPLPTIPSDDDRTTLKYYSERLIHKLEEKSQQLELANQALQREIEQHQQAEEAIRLHNAVLQTQQESSLDGILVVSQDGHVLSYNNRLLNMWGIARHEVEACRSKPLLQSTLIMQQIHERLEQPAAYLNTVKYLYAHPTERSIEEVHFKNGTIIELYSAPAIGANHRYYGRIWYYRDITESRRAKASLEASIREQRQVNEQLARALDEIHGLDKRLIETRESSPDAFVTIDHNWRFTYINAQAERLLQRKREELLGRNVWEEFHETAGTSMELNQQRAMRERIALTFEQFYPPLNKWLEVISYPINEGLGVYFRDITTRKETEAQLAYLHRVRAVLSGINALIVRTRNRDELFREGCQIAYQAGEFQMVMLCMVNPITGIIEPVASEGKDATLLTTIRNTLASTRASDTMVARAIHSGEAVVSNNSAADPQVLFADRYDSDGVQSIAVLPLASQNKAKGALVLYAREIGFFQKDEMSLLSELADDIAFAIDHIDKQERLDYLANYDTLTGLANRELFLERLEKRIAAVTSEGGKLCIGLVNIARFKSINDTLGRGSGDVLLRLMAEWMIRNSGSADQVARIGADQFAVVFDVKPRGDLIKLMESINRTLEAQSFAVNETTLHISARSGVAVFPEDGEDTDTLFRNAEVALKEARTTNVPFKFYTKDMNVAVASRLAMENALRQAVANEDFMLYYQPKASLATGKITGAEALIRWRDSQGNMVLPGQFIHLLEETGMIADVGRWALRQSTTDFLRWRQAGLASLRIAVNVSPLQLKTRNFIEDVQQSIGIDEHAAAGLELEITEGVIMENIIDSTASMSAIRAMGITIAIDDFGTGFSSLGYLAKLPVDSLKIDRSFVVNMTSGPEGLALVSTIIGLAHALNLKVVAEGVETEEQLRLLRLLKCDEVQGYVLSRPLPADEFEQKFLRDAFRLAL